MGFRYVAVVLAVTSLAVLSSCGDDDAAGPEPAVLSPLGQEGVTLAQEQGCTACHATTGVGRSTGPSWVGLAGSEVELEGGETVTADRAYLTQAIVDPRSQVRAGYANIMPTTYDLSDDEVDALLAFLEEIGTS